jgi:hypothetical protein
LNTLKLGNSLKLIENTRLHQKVCPFINVGFEKVRDDGEHFFLLFNVESMAMNIN